MRHTYLATALALFGLLLLGNWPGLYAQTTWTTQNSGTKDSFWGITYAQGTYVAVGSNGMVRTSRDGSTWTAQATPTGNMLRGVAFGNGVFVAVGLQGTVLTSRNLTTWAFQKLAPAYNLYAVSFINNQFFATGFGGLLLRSADGIHWAQLPSGTTESLVGISFVNELYIAVGEHGTIITSRGGTNWSAQVSGTSAYLNMTVYAKGLYVIAGSDNSILTSPDGVNWSIKYLNSGSHVLGIAYGQNLFIVVTNNGTVFGSYDGLNWFPQSSDTKRVLWSVLFANNQFIVVGHSGIVLKGRSSPVAITNNTLLPSESLNTYQVMSGYADQLVREKRYDQAEAYYQKALSIAQLRNGTYYETLLEVHMLLRLGSVALKRGRSQEADQYADRAYQISSKQTIHGLKAESLALKAAVAKQEKRLADALRHTAAQLVEESIAADSATGTGTTGMKRYYLQMETSHLAQEADKNTLSLRLKNNQLTYAFLITILLMILIVTLTVGYRKQRQAQQTLARQNALIQKQATQLKALDAAKSRFFANVSHELRTPLTLLLGPVKTLLQENRLTEKQTSLLQLAHRSGNQLAQLVTDILDLGKLELGKLELNVQPTPLVSFFRHQFAQFESLAESRHLHYSFDISVPDNTAVNLDQAKCRQILNNLLANAVKATPAGGGITASLTLTDGNLHLSVADTGRGIHPDDLPHLFDRYFQTTRPNQPAEGGTGIGLALCQEHTLLMGGTIAVESTPGIGSVFRVVFPVVLLPAAESSAYSEAAVAAAPLTARKPLVAPTVRTTDQPPATPDANRPTLLVVEDNPDLQAYLRLILGPSYTLITAENGQEALDQLRKAGPGPPGISLILSDLMMPVMDGHQLLDRLKADDATRHLPVIMLTARADARDKLRALRVGVDDYLLKPFDEAELLARIDNLLANRAARQQAMTEQTGTEPTPPTADAPYPLMAQAAQDWLEPFERYVWQQIANPTLSVPELADHFAMSESTLLRQLKRLTGLAPAHYVQAMRLEEARRLLESRAVSSITEVAARVGYQDATSFARGFRARFGKLPSELLES